MNCFIQTIGSKRPFGFHYFFRIRWLLILFLGWPAGASLAGNAPNPPGSNSIWAPSAKDFLGTAASNASPVYFTGAQGMLTEVFYPSPDLIQNIDMEFLVEDTAKTMGPIDAEQKLQT